MSVVAQEAGVLNRLLDARAGAADPLDRLAQTFFAAIQDVLAAPWSAAENDFIYAKTRGQRPPDFQRRLKYGSALQQIAAEDAAVHRIMAKYPR